MDQGEVDREFFRIILCDKWVEVRNVLRRLIHPDSADGARDERGA